MPASPYPSSVQSKFVHHDLPKRSRRLLGSPVDASWRNAVYYPNDSALSYRLNLHELDYTMPPREDVPYCWTGLGSDSTISTDSGDVTGSEKSESRGSGFPFDDALSCCASQESLLGELQQAELEAWMTRRYQGVGADDPIMCQRRECFNILRSTKDLVRHIHIHIVAESLSTSSLCLCSDCAVKFEDWNDLAMHICPSSPLYQTLSQRRCHHKIRLISYLKKSVRRLWRSVSKAGFRKGASFEREHFHH